MSEWKVDVETEIIETFQHLEEEIKRKFDYHFENNFRDSEGCGSKTKFGFQWDAKELLHYIKWRQANSYAMICEKICLIANNIKKGLCTNNVTNF